MELWKKDERGLYEDLFDETRYNKRWLNRVYEESVERINTFKENHPWQKSEKITQYKLNIADQCCNRGKYHEAIELYNISLCFAKTGSKYIGMAYAARSNCFKHLNKITESEIDVKLVHECSDLLTDIVKPARIVFESVDGTMNDDSSGSESEGTIDLVSDDEDEDISYFTNNIKFVAESKNKFSAVAVNDIDVGDVVFSESCYIADNFVEIYKRCCICLNGPYTNLVPCKNCTSAMFCYGKCDKSNIHRIECGVKQCAIVSPSIAVNFLNPVIRSIWIGTRMFSKMEEMMDFVSKTLGSVPGYATDKIGSYYNYDAFLRLPTDELSEEMIPLIYAFCRMILKIPDISCIFSTEEYHRFLMHLVTQHYLILIKNASIHLMQYHVRSIEPECFFDLSLAIHSSWFQHSCAPNAAFVHKDGMTTCVILRPIKKGEQIYINRQQTFSRFSAQRHQFPWDKFETQCNCIRCSHYPKEIPDNDLMHDEPNFQYLKNQTNLSGQTGEYSDDMIATLKLKCKSILMKYGRAEWSKELESVIWLYSILLNHNDPTSRMLQVKLASLRKAHYKLCYFRRPDVVPAKRRMRSFSTF